MRGLPQNRSGCKASLLAAATLFLFLIPSFMPMMDIGSNHGQGIDSSGPQFMPPQAPSQGLEPEYIDPAIPYSRDLGPMATTTANVIMVPVQFSNLNHSVKSSVGNLTNRSFSEVPGALSMNNYYKEVSYGKFNITGQVAPWVNSSHNLSYYGADGSGIDNLNGPIYRLVAEAVLLADPYVDFSKYDNNADGVVDHIFIIHAGQAQEALGGGKNDIWSHHWSVLDANESQDGAQALIVDGVQVYSYSMVSELSQIGTYAHEFGHDLGLPDLYDIDGSSQGIGKWGLMGTGSWNGGGSYPAHLCAWSKIELGWVIPVDVVGQLENLSLPMVETTGEVYRLFIGDPETSQEYFLVENRQKVGYDQKLPGSGLLIWHIDDSRTSNTDDFHRLVDLEEADEETSGDMPVHSGDAWSNSTQGFSQYAIPTSDSYDGYPSGWTIDNIGPSGGGMLLSIKIITDDVGVAFLSFERYLAEGSPATVDAYVFNYGVKDQADVVVHVTVSQGSTIIDTVDETIPLLKKKSSEIVTVVFTPAVQGNYLISAFTALPGDQVPENDEYVDVLHVTTIIFKDNVENGENSWKHSSNRPPSDLWKLIDDTGGVSQVHSPTHSWFCGVGERTGGSYVPYSDYYLERTIDMRLVKEGFLVFEHRRDLTFSVQNTSIPVSDKAYIEVMSDRATNYTVLEQFSGTSGSWETQIYDISPFLTLGVTALKVRFRLDTQFLGYGKGWWIDDIYIVGQWTDRDVAVLLNKTLTSAAPGRTYTIDVTVWNSGLVKDTYVLKAYAPPYWEASLPMDELTVDPLRSKSFILTFTASKKALATDEVEIQIEATSKGDTAASADAKLLVIVEKTYGLDVSDAATVHATPGQELTFYLNITNDGNSKQIIDLALDGSEKSWATIGANNITLEPFEVRSFEVSVVVPTKASADKTAEVFLRASTNAGLLEIGHIYIVIDRAFGLGLSPIVTGVAAVPGTSVDLSVNLTNTGNYQDKVELEYIAPPGWKVTGSTKETLGAWESITILLTVEVPTETPLSSFTIKVRATSVDGDVVEEIGLKVTAVLPDPAVFSMELSKTYLSKEGNVTITVTVENRGTGNVTEVLVTFYDGHKMFSSMMVDNLAKGEKKTISTSHRFKGGHHDVAVILTYEGAQADETNDEAHESLKVKEPSLFIPGFEEGIGVIVLSMVTLIISAFRRRH